MSVLFAALLGGFALGQAAPNLQYFAAAKVAGARVVGMINRCCVTPCLRPTEPMKQSPFMEPRKGDADRFS